MQIAMVKVQAGTAGPGALAKAIKAIDGVVQVQVADNGAMATVQYDELHVTRERIETILAAAGYRLAQPAETGCCGGCCGER